MRNTVKEEWERGAGEYGKWSMEDGGEEHENVRGHRNELRTHFYVYRSGNGKRRAFLRKNHIFIGKFADMANAGGNGGLFNGMNRIDGI